MKPSTAQSSTLHSAPQSLHYFLSVLSAFLWDCWLIQEHVKKKAHTVIDSGLWQDKCLWSSISSQNSSHTVDKPDNMTIFRMSRKARSDKVLWSTQPLDMRHYKLDLFLSWGNKLQLLFVFSLWRNSRGPSKDKGRRSTQLKQQNPL